MVLRQIGSWLLAVLLLSTAAIEIRDGETQPNFGVIDPAYRSGSEAAWFIDQSDPTTGDIATFVEALKKMEREHAERMVAWLHQN